uniref:Solute carrier family 12 member 9 n=1 Tax=Oncorhynchus tshawytscha TaxID=74940 RepID=A0AAZ3RMU6_ONCTS
MSNEHAPLLAHGVCGLSVDTAVCGMGGSEGTGEASTPNAVPRKLNTFFGVIVPTVLSMFSIVLFLRTGFVVGHAGLLQGLIMLLVAYIIISLTILSICAISTNGAVQGGGAYFMISRSLGPEFGGSIGLMFFLAKVCACGVYVLGLVEAILDIFGQDPASSSALRVLPQGYWYTVLYSSIVLLLVLLVCLVGAHIFARTSFLILLVVTISLLSIYISPLALTTPLNFLISHQGPGNHTLTYNASYTGFNGTTLRDNLGSSYTVDYSTGKVMSFASVFAVMFTSCTGIMAGANMSGELKNPSAAIPKGTIIAVLYTCIVYVLLFILASSTCERTLLVQDYGFFQRINIWPPFVTIGIYCSALSAAMCSLIGASRILHALALDQLFGFPLAPAAITSSSGNPWVAVLYTWGLAQCVVFAGQLNAIAGLVTVFYLLAYAAVDLACLALEWASAPNFRPTFQVFSWHTCLLGILSCLVMMFVINPVYSSASIILLLLLLLFLHYRSPTSSWGYISQALIFHQVPTHGDVRTHTTRIYSALRKYSAPLNFATFCHISGFKHKDIKLYFFVKNQQQFNLSSNVLFNPIHLIILLHSLPLQGGMKPNTLVLGFYDSCTPEDYFLQDPAFYESEEAGGDDFGVDLPSLQAHFPPVRHVESPRWLTPEEYVGIISDAIKMSKNVCLGRYFFQLQGESMGTKMDGAERIIDVWPLNLLRPGSTSAASVDVCSLFLLQMACVLNMASRWRHARMRIFLCVEAESSDQGWVVKEETFRELLRKLRIRASIKIVPWDSVVQLYGQKQTQDTELGELGLTRPAPALSEDFLSAVNCLLMEHSAQAAVRFLYLPRPPTHSGQSQQYLSQLEAVTHGLGPTLLIHGLTPVTCTEL